MHAIIKLFSLFLLAAVVTGDDACDVCGCYSRKGQLHVDCAGLGLTVIPDNIPTDVHKLLLHGNDLGDLGVTSTLGSTILTELKVIFVMNNPIQTITAAFFDKCPRVHTLMMHHTEIATLPAGVFNGMTRMKWLWLNNNAITALPVDAFKDLVQVREISLNGNAITTIPDGVFRDQGTLLQLLLHDNAVPEAELDCCQFCGLPTPIDLKWGLMAHDTQLRCGYDGPVSCTINGVTANYFPVNDDNAGQTYLFSSANRNWGFVGVGVMAAMVALNSVLVLV